MSKITKADATFGKRLFARFGQSLIAEGIIDPVGKSDEDIHKEIIDHLMNPTLDLQVVIDHTPTILQHARSFKASAKFALASLFYALWFEHQLNAMIASLAKRAGLSEKEVEALIRETQYRAKCSWLLRVFGVKALNVTHANKISKLMELRNAFVHYKWKPVNEQIDKELKTLLDEIEKTVKYLRGFENKYVYMEQKRRLRKVAKRDHSKAAPNNSFNPTPR